MVPMRIKAVVRVSVDAFDAATAAVKEVATIPATVIWIFIRGK